MQPTNHSPSQYVCLTGFMGSGKSTVGALLAQHLGWRFIDLDSEIVVSSGRSIADLFRDKGEAHFREQEGQVLRDILQNTPAPAVIALGGGTFISESNREFLCGHNATVVYLFAEFDELFARCCAEAGSRPLMADPQRFRQLFEERQPVYRLADFTVPVASRPPQAIATEIAGWVKSRNTASAVPD